MYDEDICLCPVCSINLFEGECVCDRCYDWLEKMCLERLAKEIFTMRVIKISKKESNE